MSDLSGMGGKGGDFDFGGGNVSSPDQWWHVRRQVHRQQPVIIDAAKIDALVRRPGLRLYVYLNPVFVVWPCVFLATTRCSTAIVTARQRWYVDAARMPLW